MNILINNEKEIKSHYKGIVLYYKVILYFIIGITCLITLFERS